MNIERDELFHDHRLYGTCYGTCHSTCSFKNDLEPGHAIYRWFQNFNSMPLYSIVWWQPILNFCFYHLITFISYFTCMQNARRHLCIVEQENNFKKVYRRAVWALIVSIAIVWLAVKIWKSSVSRYWTPILWKPRRESCTQNSDR